MHRRVFFYAIVVAVSVATIAGLLYFGETWFPASGMATAGAAQAASPAPAETLRRPLALLIIQLLVIVLATQMGGSLATLLRQPAVVGEIAAGPVLGPSFVGQVAPAVYAFLFPESSIEMLQLLIELVALNVGYDLGILSPHMFTMLVVMALVTTAMTGPLIDLASSPDARRAGRVARR